MLCVRAVHLFTCSLIHCLVYLFIYLTNIYRAPSSYSALGILGAAAVYKKNGLLVLGEIQSLAGKTNTQTHNELMYDKHYQCGGKHNMLRGHGRTTPDPLTAVHQLPSMKCKYHASETVCRKHSKAPGLQGDVLNTQGKHSGT